MLLESFFTTILYSMRLRWQVCHEFKPKFIFFLLNFNESQGAVTKSYTDANAALKLLKRLFLLFKC